MVAGDELPDGVNSDRCSRGHVVGEPGRFTISVDSLAMSAVVDSMAVDAERHFEFPFASAGEGDKLYAQLESFGKAYEHRAEGPKYQMLALHRTTNPPGTVSLQMRRNA